MCRMLAKIAAEPFCPEYELLSAPHSLAAQSTCAAQPDDPWSCGPHASGCGMSWREAGALRTEKRGADDRWDDRFKKAIRSMRTDAVIAHNRLASPGLRVDVSCSHPFEGTIGGENVSFCHNGGISNLMDEAKSRGLSDSKIFLEKMEKDVSSLEPTLLADWLRERAREWKYTSLSALLLSPSRLFAWRCFSDADPHAARFEQYYTLHFRSTEREACFASEPIDESGWRLLGNMSFMACENGGGSLAVSSRALR